jgi:hypothetical protein
MTPHPHPSPEYIITEEQLKRFSEAEIYAGEANSIAKIIRSHPHTPQSEREKVLDEVLERMYKLQKKGMFTCLFLRHEIRALRTIKQEEQV